jgi:tetratricopeptide (TPR) repeat protein
MKKGKLKLMLDRYLSARKAHKELYFDADEIDELLDNYEESIDPVLYDEILSLGLKLHPGNIDLQVKQCWRYVATGEYDTALDLIRQVGDTDNQELETLELECYCMLNQYHKVIEQTERMIAGKREYMDLVFEYIAPILSDAKMEAEALDYVNRGLTLFPDSLALKEELCYLLELEGNISRAIEVCNEMIDEDPYAYEYWYTLGRLFYLLEDFEKAVEAFDFALTCEHDPDDEDNKELKLLKAYSLYMNESYKKALELYAELAKDETLVDRIKPFFAECYIKLEEYEKAYRLLHEWIAREGKHCDSVTYIHYMYCCAKTHREQSALDALDAAGSVFNGDVQILAVLAYAYMENQDDRNNLAVIRKLFDLIEDIGVDDDFLSCTAENNYSLKDVGNMLRQFGHITLVEEEIPVSLMNKPVFTKDLAREYVNDKAHTN